MSGGLRIVRPAPGSVTAPLPPAVQPPEPGPDPADPIAWAGLAARGPDRSRPRPVTLEWAGPESLPPGAAFEVRVSDSPDLLGGRRILTLARRTRVDNLRIGARYHWSVRVRENGRILDQTGVSDFLTHPEPPRWIRAPGMTNVRDVGGWPAGGGARIRQGRIFRGSEMNSHLQITEEGRRVLIEELGIRTDLDLRGDGEETGPVLDPERVAYLNIPVHPYAAIARDPYRTAYRRVFEVFADPARHPILFHCWGGADRAGTVAFLLGAILGQRREDLVRDYELTSLSIWGPRSRESGEFRGFAAALESFAPGRRLRRQAEACLLAAGTDPAALRRIREMLLVEPASAPR